MFICDHCKITVDALGQKFCHNCGWPLATTPIVAGSLALPAMPRPQALAGDMLPSEIDNAIADVSLWLSRETLCAGQPQVIPCKIRNDAGIAITTLRLTAQFWQQADSYERTLHQILPPGVECSLGIPFCASVAGHYLLTQIHLELTLEDGEIHRWQTRDELCFAATASDQQTPVVYHINIQDYAQLFGNIELAAGGHNWQEMALVPTIFASETKHNGDRFMDRAPNLQPPSPSATILVEDANKAHRYYLSAGGDAWLGRSGKAEFPVADNQPAAADHLQISGRHARIYVRKDVWYIEDCSRNGTQVNSLPLKTRERYPLRDGDVIGLGPSLTLVARVYGCAAAQDFALRLVCRDGSDGYLAFCHHLWLGGTVQCALPLSEFTGRAVASLSYDAGYRLHLFCPFRIGQENGFSGQIVLLQSGMRVQIGNTTLQFEQR